MLVASHPTAPLVAASSSTGVSILRVPHMEQEHLLQLNEPAVLLRWAPASVEPVLLIADAAGALVLCQGWRDARFGASHVIRELGGGVIRAVEWVSVGTPLEGFAIVSERGIVNLFWRSAFDGVTVGARPTTEAPLGRPPEQRLPMQHVAKAAICDAASSRCFLLAIIADAAATHVDLFCATPAK